MVTRNLDSDVLTAYGYCLQAMTSSDYAVPFVSQSSVVIGAFRSSLFLRGGKAVALAIGRCAFVPMFNLKVTMIKSSGSAPRLKA